MIDNGFVVVLENQTLAEACINTANIAQIFLLNITSYAGALSLYNTPPSSTYADIDSAFIGGLLDPVLLL